MSESTLRILLLARQLELHSYPLVLSLLYFTLFSLLQSMLESTPSVHLFELVDSAINSAVHKLVFRLELNVAFVNLFGVEQGFSALVKKAI